MSKTVIFYLRPHKKHMEMDMAKIGAFEEYTQRYENWFEDHSWVYQAELRAVKSLLPAEGHGVEIGVGSGRFAAPLCIKTGVEPSPRMRKIAEERGIQVLDGVAESLPFADEKFDFALMVTVICFVDDLSLSIKEAARVLRTGGKLLIGFVDRESPIGRFYQKHKEKSELYKEATFFSTQEIKTAMENQGFRNFQFRQTILKGLTETTKNEPVLEGHGQGSFVVISGKKK